MVWKTSASTLATNARYPGLTITDDILREWRSEGDSKLSLIRVRPHTDSHDITVGYRFCKQLANDLESDDKAASHERRRARRLRHQFSFEIWNTDQKFQYVMGAADADELTKDIRARFTDVTIAQFTPPTPAQSTPLRPGWHLAGARIGLKKGCRNPLGHPGSKGVRITADDSPHHAIYAKMHSDYRNELSLLQVVFEQVSDDWLAKTDSLLSWRPYIMRSETDPTAQKDIDAQSGQSAFRVVIRVFAIADERKRATKRVQSMVGMFSDMDNPATGQKLVSKEGLLRGYELQREFTNALARRLPHQSRLTRTLGTPRSVLTDRELGMLVRFTGDLGVGQVDSSTIKDAGSAPTNADDPDDYLSLPE